MLLSFADALRRDGCGSERYTEIAGWITDYDCYVDVLYDLLGEHANLEELSDLASQLDDMGQDKYERFQAAMETGDHTGSIPEEHAVQEEIYEDLLAGRISALDEKLAFAEQANREYEAELFGQPTAPEKEPSTRERLEDAKRECGSRKGPDRPAPQKKPPELGGL